MAGLPLRRALLVGTFLLALGVAGAAAYSTSVAHVAYENEGSIAAEVVDVAPAAEEGRLRAEIRVTNPTGVAVDYSGATLNAYLSNDSETPVARTSGVTLDHQTVPAGGSTVVVAELNVRDDVGPSVDEVRAAAERGEIRVAGHLWGRIVNESVTTKVTDATQEDDDEARGSDDA